MSDPAEVLEQGPVKLEVGPEHLGQGQDATLPRGRMMMMGNDIVVMDDFLYGEPQMPTTNVAD